MQGRPSPGTGPKPGQLEKRGVGAHVCEPQGGSRAWKAASEEARAVAVQWQGPRLNVALALAVVVAMVVRMGAAGAGGAAVGCSGCMEVGAPSVRAEWVMGGPTKWGAEGGWGAGVACTYMTWGP